MSEPVLYDAEEGPRTVVCTESDIMAGSDVDDTDWRAEDRRVEFSGNSDEASDEGDDEDSDDGYDDDDIFHRRPIVRLLSEAQISIVETLSDVRLLLAVFDHYLPY